ncbi:fungal-specific transcription factor domain-containing protein [Aspergillus venezuelensis]
MFDLDSPEKFRFLCHFATVIPRALPLVASAETGEARGVMFFILEASRQYRMVLEAVLALGASHLIRCFSGTDQPGSQARQQKLVHEKEKLLKDGQPEERPYDEDLEQRKAPLVYHYLRYLVHISDGPSSTNCLARLDSARGILRDMLHEGVLIDQTFLEVFMHHDTLSSVTVPLRPQNVEPLKKMMMDQDHFLPLDIIARIATLRSEAAGATVPPASAITQAIEISQDLAGPVPLKMDELPPEYQTIRHAYTSACFIWLYSIIYPNGIEDDKVQQVVCQGVEDMLSLHTLGSRPFLLFPIFIVGMASIRQEDRDAIEVLFERLDSSFLLTDTEGCHRIVRSSWEIYSGGQARSWDWMRLMDVEGIDLILS